MKSLAMRQLAKTPSPAQVARRFVAHLPAEVIKFATDPARGLDLGYASLANRPECRKILREAGAPVSSELPLEYTRAIDDTLRRVSARIPPRCYH